MTSILRLVFFLVDLAFLNITIALSYIFFDSEWFGVNKVNSIYLFIFSNLTWLFLIVVSNPYNYSRSWGIPKIVKSQLSFIFIHLLVVASLIFFFKKEYTPVQIATVYLLFVPSFFASKVLVLFMANLFSKEDIRTKNVIIVGQGDLARGVRRYFLVHPELLYRFLNLFELDDKGMPLDRIQEFCNEKKVHEIYCCLPDVDNDDLKRLIDFGLNSLIRVKLIPDLSSLHQRSLELEQYDQIPVLNINPIPLDELRNQVVKRVFDIIFSFAVIVTILSWLVPFIAIFIKLDSRGPVFFIQKRNGRYNRSFSCLKFRTMIVNAEADTKQATQNDTRITKLGNFLRKSSLDEVPQFFNVFMGDMSVIGPRPHPIKLNEKFFPVIKKLMSRHYVKPGITGLAQCMGYRGETSLVEMRNRIKLDRFYIENWSFALDIRIIFQTIHSLAKGSDKAY